MNTEETKKNTTTKKTTSKTTTKKAAPKKKAATKKVVKPKIDYKKKFQDAEKIIKQLEKKIEEQKKENETNILAFQEKAAGFSKKAQEEVNKIKRELNESLENEKEHMKKYGSQRLLEGVIEPLLNIELAVNAGKDNEAVSAYVMGFEMLLNQLYQELESFGVTKISPKLNEVFDPEMHYALKVEEGENENTITKVVKDGFKLHERVLKPATVIIVK